MNLRELSADSKLSEDELREIVDSKVKLGQFLKERLEVYSGIEGSIKIQRKINQEIKFLEKVLMPCPLLQENYNIIVLIYLLDKKFWSIKITSFIVQ